MIQSAVTDPVGSIIKPKRATENRTQRARIWEIWRVDNTHGEQGCCCIRWRAAWTGGGWGLWWRNQLDQQSSSKLGTNTWTSRSSSLMKQKWEVLTYWRRPPCSVWSSLIGKFIASAEDVEWYRRLSWLFVCLLAKYIETFWKAFNHIFQRCWWWVLWPWGL